MKNIFISSFHPLISRNILSTKIVAMLTVAGYQLVILVPRYKKEYFNRIFNDKQIIIEGVEMSSSVRTLRVGILKRIAEAIPNTERARIGRKLTLSGTPKNIFYYYFFYLPVSFLGRSKFAIRFLRLIDYLVTLRGRFYSLFDEYKPVLIFSTDIQNEHDVALMQDAFCRKIPVLSMVRSWDNLVTRGIRFLPDRIIVHNQMIVEQAVSLYGVESSRLKIVGIPHYDRYLKSSFESRDLFFKKIGLDSTKKTVLYFPLCDYRVISNQKINLDKVILEELSKIDANVIVRFPPSETVSLDGFKRPDNFFYDFPGFVFDQAIVTNREVTKEDDLRLMQELTYSDVIVTGPSTACIDAAFFNKPIVFIDFRLGNDVEGTIFEYQSEHIVNILNTGGVKRVFNSEELLSHINGYFKESALNEDGRFRIVREQVGARDGKSSERTAMVILDYLNEIQRVKTTD